MNRSIIKIICILAVLTCLGEWGYIDCAKQSQSGRHLRRKTTAAPADNPEPTAPANIEDKHENSSEAPEKSNEETDTSKAPKTHTDRAENDKDSSPSELKHENDLEDTEMRLPLSSTHSGRRLNVAPRPKSRAILEDSSIFAHDDSPRFCGLGFGNFGGCFIPPYRPKTNTKRPCNSKTTESFLDDDDDDDDCERKESLLQKPNSMSRSLLLKPLLRCGTYDASNRCVIKPEYPDSHDNHEPEYKPYPYVCKKCHDDNPPYPDPDPYPYPDPRPYPDPHPDPDDDDELYPPRPIPSIPLKPSGPIISIDWPPFIPFIPPFVPEYTARPKPSVVPIPLKPLKPYKSNEPDPDLEPFWPFLPPFIRRPKPQPAHLIPPISPIIRIPLEQAIDHDSRPSSTHVKRQTSRPKPLIPILPSRATISDSPLKHDRSIVKTSSLRSITSGGSSLDPPPFNDDH